MHLPLHILSTMLKCLNIADKLNLTLSRAQEVADYNQQLQMAQTSGDAAKAERGRKVDDDTTLPLKRIKDGANVYGGQVISSGDVARESRRKKKKNDAVASPCNAKAEKRNLSCVSILRCLALRLLLITCMRVNYGNLSLSYLSMTFPL